MKTKLPEKISSRAEAESFLRELYQNGESYHPEDDAHDISWDLPHNQAPTYEEAEQLNRLMANIYALPELANYPDVEWDPCGFLLDLWNSEQSEQ